MLSLAKDIKAIIMKLNLFSNDRPIKHIIITLNYFVYLFAIILVGYFPDGLIAFLFVPLRRFEIGYLFLGVVVKLLLEEGLVLHVLLVEILWAFS